MGSRWSFSSGSPLLLFLISKVQKVDGVFHQVLFYPSTFNNKSIIVIYSLFFQFLFISTK